MERKVALVTGASRGIGRAIALKLASRGYDIVVNYNGNSERAESAVNECKSLGVAAISIKANVADGKEVAEMVAIAKDKFGRIDVLVNNSGITRDGLLLRMKEQDFDDVISVNLKGTFNCISQISKIMFRQKSGVIINMASVVGLIGNIGQANYAASKAGVIALTKTTAKELAGRNIRCNAIAPGFIRTDMTDVLDDKTKGTILEGIPLKKFGEADDVADLVVFLAGDESRYITGQVIHVDGGMVM